MMGDQFRYLCFASSDVACREACSRLSDCVSVLCSLSFCCVLDRFVDPQDPFCFNLGSLFEGVKFVHQR